MWICKLAKRAILVDGEEVVRNRKLNIYAILVAGIPCYDGGIATAFFTRILVKKR